MNKDNYEDIINLPNYEPKNHKRMSLEARAAQFAPFQALTEYDSEVKEAARLTDKKIEIDEGLKLLLNDKLQILNDNIKQNNKVTITYFVKDTKKDGGKYISVTGNIKKIDMVNELVILKDNSIIPINDIININGDLFKTFY